LDDDYFSWGNTIKERNVIARVYILELAMERIDRVIHHYFVMTIREIVDLATEMNSDMLLRNIEHRSVYDISL